MVRDDPLDPLQAFHPAVRTWFCQALGAPTAAQAQGWPAISSGAHALVLAPTGSGKTLAAFLWALDRLMFAPAPGELERRCRVIYVSPLKALAVDVERNLRAPLQGIAEQASAVGAAFCAPEVALRTGDTPAAQRARFLREPAEILITTPESLYLMLTSKVREALRSVDTVIVDEIHALVPTKRGAHLALSLERLEVLADGPVQRIGLSATARPAREVARFLGGSHEVKIVDAQVSKSLSLRVELPALERSPDDADERDPNVPATSPWSAIHPRLLELIRGHRSTLIFVNARRTAERLAAALNTLAGEELVKAHHGSLARAQRENVEAELKAGLLRGLVATRSLELGIDMGAIDFVVQIEAPPSVASGLQRLGRAGHGVGQRSAGVIIPKHRADLLACAAMAQGMLHGDIEALRMPQNPLDVLAQHLVAMCSVEPWTEDALFARITCAAPFAKLSRRTFSDVLDLLSGRTASQALAELKPRLTWDRKRGILVGREGAHRVAVTNPGTIPDRGLYGVFLADASPPVRVGELDEEMVYETKVGEVFALGASSWRVVEITFDHVRVVPAPGEAAKLPFWHGDAAMRPVEAGRRIGALVHALQSQPASSAHDLLTHAHALTPDAATSLLAYLDAQREATGSVPSTRALVIERFVDEVGDWRVALLSPLGARVHAPWALAIQAQFRAQGVRIDAFSNNDGIGLHLPAADRPPELAPLLPAPEVVEARVLAELGESALFAARFREAAARALLLPRRRPGQRAPLWQQRRRAADLLSAARSQPDFPILLEATRECLADVFDLPALCHTLGEIQSGAIQVAVADTKRPSPFARAMLFGELATAIYEGDAPPAERRARALAIDPAQLRELLGEPALRTLLDPASMDALEAEAQHTAPDRQIHSADGLHDLLLAIGDLTLAELAARSNGDPAPWIGALRDAGQIAWVTLAHDARLIAAEDAARYRDGLGVALPPGLAEALLTKVPDPLGDLLRRYARTHAPFTAAELVVRFGISRTVIDRALAPLIDAGQVLEGAFRPGGDGVEFCDAQVLQRLRARARARARREAEPVAPEVLGRFLTHWQGLVERRRGADALLDAIEQLQGLPLPASVLEREILPARIDGYLPGDLDPLIRAGEVVWRGTERMGARDGRVALFLTDALPELCAMDPEPELSLRERAALDALTARGALHFGELHAALGGLTSETLAALWGLVWKGLCTHDSLGPLRTLVGATRPQSASRYRSRRAQPQPFEGRWSRIGAPDDRTWPSPTARATRQARQLLARYGLVTREVVAAEGLPGGFAAIYPVLGAMEGAGQVRRGYFASGLGGAQFALPAVPDRLRALRNAAAPPEVLMLSAVDPANPYGALLAWSVADDRALARVPGAHVVLVDGALSAFIARGAKQVRTFLPAAEPLRSKVARAVSQSLAELARLANPRQGLLLTEIDGQPAHTHALSADLIDMGFQVSARGLQHRAR